MNNVSDIEQARRIAELENRVVGLEAFAKVYMSHFERLLTAVENHSETINKLAAESLQRAKDTRDEQNR